MILSGGTGLVEGHQAEEALSFLVELISPISGLSKFVPVPLGCAKSHPHFNYQMNAVLMDGNHCISSFTIDSYNFFNFKEPAVGSSRAMHLLSVAVVWWL